MYCPPCSPAPSALRPCPAGKKIDFVRHPDVAVQYADQVAPFEGAFGCSLAGGRAWPATLFRLPLRTPEQAATSTISKQASGGGECVCAPYGGPGSTGRPAVHRHSGTQ